MNVLAYIKTPIKNESYGKALEELDATRLGNFFGERFLSGRRLCMWSRTPQTLKHVKKAGEAHLQRLAQKKRWSDESPANPSAHLALFRAAKVLGEESDLIGVLPFPCHVVNTLHLSNIPCGYLPVRACSFHRPVPCCDFGICSRVQEIRRLYFCKLGYPAENALRVGAPVNQERPSAQWLSFLA